MAVEIGQKAFNPALSILVLVSQETGHPLLDIEKEPITFLAVHSVQAIADNKEMSQ
jgi:hypothetical protein